jgi:transcriptional regulator with PAS, ATPase and Fis domain
MAEARTILGVLEKHGGNRKEAAEELGISVVTLWRKMKKLGLKETIN